MGVYDGGDYCQGSQSLAVDRFWVWIRRPKPTQESVRRNMMRGA